MKIQRQYYETLTNEKMCLLDLDSADKKIYDKMVEYYQSKPSFFEFDRFCSNIVLKPLEKKLSRSDIIRTPIYEICRDLHSRLGIEQGLLRKSDYRDILRKIILENFDSYYKFCKHTGIDEGFLSNVLNKKKSFSIENLESILDKIGYVIEIRKKHPISFKKFDHKRFSKKRLENNSKELSCRPLIAHRTDSASSIHFLKD